MRYFVTDSTGEPRKANYTGFKKWLVTANRQIACTSLGGIIITTEFTDLGICHPDTIWRSIARMAGGGVVTWECGGSREQAMAQHDALVKAMAAEAVNRQTGKGIL